MLTFLQFPQFNQVLYNAIKFDIISNNIGLIQNLENLNLASRNFAKL